MINFYTRRFNNIIPAKALLAALCLFIMNLTVSAQIRPAGKYVVIGYVGGYKGLVDTSMLDVKKLTHINYAFVNIQHNRAWLTNLKTDSTNFKNLNLLKKKNPDLKILISIGGWAWSGNFSDAALSDTSRKAFAASAVAIIKQYQLDGIDIDWEYPDQLGIGNVHRPEDKQNYTLLFQALRAELDVMQQQTGQKLLLTAAVGAFKRFLEHTEMDKAQTYLNYINLMTYDYFQDSLGIAIHHSNLFPSKIYHTADYAAKAVTDYMAAGVPASKLVMGLAFYGRSSIVADNVNHGLGEKTTAHASGGGYTFLRDSLINQKGFKYYKDNDAKSAYLFNETTRQFISFDDEWSVRNKCKYVKKEHMAGVMFWEYSDDKKAYLLTQANQSLR